MSSPLNFYEEMGLSSDKTNLMDYISNTCGFNLKGKEGKSKKDGKGASSKSGTKKKGGQSK